MSILKRYFSGEVSLEGQKFIKAAIEGDVRSSIELMSLNPTVVNYQDEVTGITGLMVFASDGNKSMVEYICGIQEADVSIADQDDRTAAFLALMIGRSDIVDILTSRLHADIGEFDTETQATIQAEDVASTDNVVTIFPKRTSASDPAP